MNEVEGGFCERPTRGRVPRVWEFVVARLIERTSLNRLAQVAFQAHLCYEPKPRVETYSRETGICVGGENSERSYREEE